MVHCNQTTVITFRILECTIENCGDCSEGKSECTSCMAGFYKSNNQCISKYMYKSVTIDDDIYYMSQCVISPEYVT